MNTQQELQDLAVEREKTMGKLKQIERRIKELTAKQIVMGPPPTSNQMALIANIDNNRFAALAAIDDDSAYIMSDSDESEDSDSAYIMSDSDDESSQDSDEREEQRIREEEEEDRQEEILEYMRNREQYGEQVAAAIAAGDYYEPPHQNVNELEAYMQAHPPPPGMHYQDGVLQPMWNYAPPPPHPYQGPPPPPPQQYQRQVTFFVSSNYRGRNPLPPHKLKQRSQRTFYVSSNYRGNKPKPIHVLKRRNFQQKFNPTNNYQPSYPSYQQQAPQHYY